LAFTAFHIHYCNAQHSKGRCDWLDCPSKQSPINHIFHYCTMKTMNSLNWTYHMWLITVSWVRQFQYASRSNWKYIRATTPQFRSFCAYASAHRNLIGPRRWVNVFIDVQIGRICDYRPPTPTSIADWPSWTQPMRARPRTFHLLYVWLPVSGCSERRKIEGPWRCTPRGIEYWYVIVTQIRDYKRVTHLPNRQKQFRFRLGSYW
jgi:hypothetical protein